jgi:hypothetical protein
MFIFNQDIMFTDVLVFYDQTIKIQLVGGVKHSLCSIIYGIILPIDELIFFKMVIAPPTRQSRDSQSRSLMLKSPGEARCTAQLPHKSSGHSPSPIVVTLLEKPVFAHCPPFASPCWPKIFLYFLNHMLSPFWLFSQVREGWHRGLRQDALGCQGQGNVTAETWDTRPGKHSQFAIENGHRNS